MPITERTLKRWRKEALEQLKLDEGGDHTYNQSFVFENLKCILRMTAELLDNYLLRKK